MENLIKELVKQLDENVNQTMDVCQLDSYAKMQESLDGAVHLIDEKMEKGEPVQKYIRYVLDGIQFAFTNGAPSTENYVKIEQSKETIDKIRKIMNIECEDLYNYNENSTGEKIVKEVLQRAINAIS